MQRIHRYLSSFLLGAALVAPMTMLAGPQERAEERREERRERERRYYDRHHRDYHVWNSREDVAYRRWLEERRERNHREFYALRRNEQAEYWEWRHRHPDHD